MRKKIVFLLPLFLAACSESGESPVITIERLYVDGTDSELKNTSKENYANRLENLPVMEVGDQVNAFLLLDGNGSELKTFRIQNDDEVSAKLFYERADVSTEGNLTDEEKGQLRFKDGVTQARVLVRATVDRIDESGNVKLSFYLSSKAECEGAQEEIGLEVR